jgi:hypothetical protein
MVNNDSRSVGGSTATVRPPKRTAPVSHGLHVESNASLTVSVQDSGFDPAEADNLFATGKANKAGPPT